MPTTVETMRLTYQKNKIVHRPVPGTPKAESARSCKQVKLPWGWFEKPDGRSKGVDTVTLCDSDGIGTNLDAGCTSRRGDVTDGLETWTDVSGRRHDKCRKRHEYGCEHDHENVKFN